MCEISLGVASMGRLHRPTGIVCFPMLINYLDRVKDLFRIILKAYCNMYVFVYL